MQGKRADGGTRTKAPGAREPLDPMFANMFCAATGASAAMYAPTEGAAAREVAASAASVTDEERLRTRMVGIAGASVSSGRASVVYLCRAWRAWKKTTIIHSTNQLTAARVVDAASHRESPARQLPRRPIVAHGRGSKHARENEKRHIELDFSSDTPEAVVRERDSVVVA
jgi:hypothetical protein